MKLTPEQRREIEDRLRAGERQGDLAMEYGVSQTWVCRIAKMAGAAHTATFASKARVAQNREIIEESLEKGESCNSIARRLRIDPHCIYPIRKARLQQEQRA